jgi:hypothetical protein
VVVIGISVVCERTAPGAMVPSWQDRQSREVPVGCPTAAFRLVL